MGLITRDIAKKDESNVLLIKRVEILDRSIGYIQPEYTGQIGGNDWKRIGHA